jgi:hypothetical protein
MAKEHEIESAYYQGRREMRGIDPEVAEDLGIPASPEAYERHLASAKEMTEASMRAAMLTEEPVPYVRCGDCLNPSCPGCKH